MLLDDVLLFNNVPKLKSDYIPPTIMIRLELGWIFQLVGIGHQMIDNLKLNWI